MMLQPPKRHLGQHALGVGTFRHVFLILDLDLVAVSFACTCHRTVMVLEGPAAVADRADIDEAGLHLVHALRKGTPKPASAPSRRLPADFCVSFLLLPLVAVPVAAPQL